MSCPDCSVIFPSKSKLERHLNSKTKCIDQMNTENLIKRSKQKFENRFSYDKTIYIDAITNVIIKCNEHNEEFPIRANNHLNGKGGCKKCSGVYIKTWDELVEEFKAIHGDKFIYDEETKNSYENSNSVLKIYCPTHGYFNQSVKCHTSYGRCDDCIIETLEEWHQIKINSIDRTKKIYVHPIYTNYSIDIETDLITNSNNKRSSCGSKEKRGTIGFMVYYCGKTISISLHKFKWEAVYNEAIPKNCEVDHRNQNPSDNSIENLQCLTRLDHGRKTAKDNPERGKKIGKTQGVSGTAYNPTTKVSVEFNSITEFAEKINSSTGNIHRFLNNRSNSSPMGFSKIIFNKYEEIKGEVWKKHPTLPFEVSNMGRIKNRRRITNGTPDAKGYLHYSGNTVHKLVMETFGPDKTDPTHTVDHINGVKIDNRIDNLRWATKSEQCFNTSRSKCYSPRKINGYTGEIMDEYSSIKDVMKKEKVTHALVHTISSRKRDWFINLKPDDLNKNRLQFVSNVLNSSKCKSKDINGFTGCEPDNGSSPFWEYKFNSSKFSENKKNPMFLKRRQKQYDNSYDYIKKFAIENNAAQVIQCYFRSYINFRT